VQNSRNKEEASSWQNVRKERPQCMQELRKAENTLLWEKLDKKQLCLNVWLMFRPRSSNESNKENRNQKAKHE